MLLLFGVGVVVVIVVVLAVLVLVLVIAAVVALVLAMLIVLVRVIIRILHVVLVLISALVESVVVHVPPVALVCVVGCVCVLVCLLFAVACYCLHFVMCARSQDTLPENAQRSDQWVRLKKLSMKMSTLMSGAMNPLGTMTFGLVPMTLTGMMKHGKTLKIGTGRMK